MFAAADTASEPPIIAVVGPTASGKTAVGIALAERLNGEIVSADAVAVYRGLDIGSAKPDEREKARAAFHLIDVADPGDDFTVADFARQADAAIDRIRARGRVPLLVGGTGLYVRSVTATLSIPEVPPQPQIREALWAEVSAQPDNSGVYALHERLKRIDPVSAAKILPGDAKRIIRALEVWEVTGKPLSSFHTPEGVQGIPRPNTCLFGLQLERETLYRRIEARIDAMMAAGFLNEVRGLWEQGYGPERKSMQSLGYRHLLRHLAEGKPLDEAVSELKRDTRRYAKRQISWFHADKRIRWIETEDTLPEETAAQIAAEIAY